MIARIMRFFKVLGEIDLLKTSILERDRDRDRNATEQIKSLKDRIQKLEVLFSDESGSKIYVKKFIDKQTGEAVTQRITETREKIS